MLDANRQRASTIASYLRLVQAGTLVETSHVRLIDTDSDPRWVDLPFVQIDVPPAGIAIESGSLWGVEQGHALVGCVLFKRLTAQGMRALAAGTLARHRNWDSLVTDEQGATCGLLLSALLGQSTSGRGLGGALERERKRLGRPVDLWATGRSVGSAKHLRSIGFAPAFSDASSLLRYEAAPAVLP